MKSAAAPTVQRVALDKAMTAPVSARGLFGGGSDSEEDVFENEEVETTVVVGGQSIQIRERAFHPLNANAVWPGTFVLADWIMENRDVFAAPRRVLELGSATGALSIFMTRIGVDLTTSDVNDDEVQSQIAANYACNSLEAPPHLPHTWGEPLVFPVSPASASARPGAVPSSAEGAGPVPEGSAGGEAAGRAALGEVGGRGWPQWDVVVASDILLYVKAYPALVRSLEVLLGDPPVADGGRAREGAELGAGGGGAAGQRAVFIMSWQRRLKESASFFELIKERGFLCEHLGRLIYRIELPAAAGRAGTAAAADLR